MSRCTPITTPDLELPGARVLRSIRSHNNNETLISAGYCMTDSIPVRVGRGRFAGIVATALLALGALSGCVSLYVDNGLRDVQPSEYQHAQTPQPVQLLFSFTTKGTANTRATNALKQEVGNTVTASGLFSSVSSEPLAGGALLSITIDNVPITSQDEAVAKGFATGLTFGLVGSAVSDGYVCTVQYQAGPAAPRLTEVVHHAIHATVGAHGAPANSTKAASAEIAVKTMARQAVGNALKALAADPAFGH
jgi:hypothetical protein